MFCSSITNKEVKMNQVFKVTINSVEGNVLDSDVQYVLNTYLRSEVPTAGVESVEVEEEVE